MHIAPDKKRGIFYGWWIVFACSTISLYGSGVFYYGFTAFFEPMVNEFGWSRAATSLAFSLQRLQGGIAAPVIGYLVDKLGTRILQISGMFVLGGGLVLMAGVDSLTLFYIAFLVASIGGSAGSGMVGQVAVANWFVRNRSKALGLMSAGVGISGAIVPVLVWLIGTYGWRTTLIVAGVGTWVVCIPMALLVKNRPERYGLLPDGDLPQSTDASRDEVLVVETKLSDSSMDGDFSTKEAAKTGAFWALTAAITLSQLATGALFVHEIPYLSSIGIPPATGALVVMAMTLFSIVGRLGFGWLGDIIEKRYVMAITFGLQFIGMVIAAFATELWHIAFFVLAFGPGYGGAIPVRPALQADYFGRKYFGTIQGVMLGLTTFGGVVGPVFAGWMFDISGSYSMAFLILAVAFAPALPAILVAKKPVKKIPKETLSTLRETSLFS